MKYISLLVLTSLLLLVSALSQEEPYDQWIYFSDPELFTEGSLDGQSGWEVLQGNAEVATNQYGHTNLEILPNAGSQTHVRWNGDFPVEDELVTISLEFELAQSSIEGLDPIARILGVELARGPGPDRGLLFVSDGAGEWFPLDEAEPFRVTLRFDRRNGRSVFDVANQIRHYVLVNLPAPNDHSPLIEFFGHPEYSSYITSIHISTALRLLRSDQDDDGLDDYWEESFGLSTEEDNRDEDLDGDGLTNIEEWSYGTDPDLADSDFDGVDDYDEVLAGSDPSRGRWPNLGNGRIPYEPRDEDILDGYFYEYRPFAGTTAPIEQRIALLDIINEDYAPGNPRENRTEIFDEFLEQFPDSPYRFWLQAVIAKWHFDAGDWLIAQSYFQRVWENIDPPEIADRNQRSTYGDLSLSLASTYVVQGKLAEVRSILLTIPDAKNSRNSGWYWSLVIASDYDGTRGEAPGFQSHRVPLANLLIALGGDSIDLDGFYDLPTSMSGMSLADMKQRAADYGIDLGVAFREIGAEIIHPCISLNRIGSFSYIKYSSDSYGDFHYYFRNPFEQSQRRLKPETLDRESTGYFLIAADTELPDGWRWAHEAEAVAQIGDRMIPPGPRHVEASLKMLVPNGLLHETAAFEISGSPGDYVIQYARGLMTGPFSESFSDMIPIRLTEEEPVVVIPMDWVMSNRDRHDQAFFRLR